MTAPAVPFAGPPVVAPSAAEVVAFLSDPAAYPHHPASVEVVQTHISYVALAPPRVYKVKKPVSLGFLDFSTLERRRHFCAEEVRINRRLCDGVYRGVVPITRTPDGLAWGGPGETVEVAVEMRLLGGDGFLDRRVENGTVTEADLDRLADRLVAFYQAQPATPEAAEWGRPERLRISTDENAAQTRPLVGDLISGPAHEALCAATDGFLARHARRLQGRRAAGRVLEGHGDLRAEHVHLGDDAICVFDAIEFSERLRSVDVASEVAFLAMDLDRLGRPDLARRFAERLAHRLRDPGLLRVLDFYKAYRAVVRGKVEAMRSEEREVPAAERAASRERARRYFQLALGYAVAGSRPLVVGVMGGVATGKSTLARALGDALGWEVVSSDRVRKRAAGAPLAERGTAAARAALYAPERTQATYRALRDAALAAAREGRGVVLDATFSRLSHRDALREALGAAGVAHRWIELTAPPDVVRQRLAARDGQPVVSDARLDDAEALAARYQPPDALEDAEHVVVAADGDLEGTVRRALRELVRLAPDP